MFIHIFIINIKIKYLYKSLYIIWNYILYIGFIINKSISFDDNNYIYDTLDIFDINIYKKYNDLIFFSNSDLINHYLLYGHHENRIYKLPNNFNIEKYSKYEDLLNLSNVKFYFKIYLNTF